MEGSAHNGPKEGCEVFHSYEFGSALKTNLTLSRVVVTIWFHEGYMVIPKGAGRGPSLSSIIHVRVITKLFFCEGQKTIL